MTDIINTLLTVIALNVNELNTQVKRQRLEDWIKKKHKLHAVYKRHTLHSKTQLESKGLKKIKQAFSNWKRAGVAVLISDKIVFKIYIVARDRRGTFYSYQGVNLLGNIITFV